MLASPPLWAVWTDVLWCLGLGLAIAALRDAAGLLLGSSRPVQFVLDLAAFAAAAVLACGFATGLSAAGQVRWYMAAAMALGAGGWYTAMAGALHRAARTLIRGLAWPLRLASRKLAGPAKQWVRDRRKLSEARKAAKKRQKAKKSGKITLQKRGRVLYN